MTEDRRAQHRGKVVLYSDVQKQLVHATTISEKDDTPESIALRLRMLQELGSPRTFKNTKTAKYWNAAADRALRRWKQAERAFSQYRKEWHKQVKKR